MKKENIKSLEKSLVFRSLIKFYFLRSNDHKYLKKLKYLMMMMMMICILSFSEGRSCLKVLTQRNILLGSTTNQPLLCTHIFYLSNLDYKPTWSSGPQMENYVLSRRLLPAYCLTILLCYLILWHLNQSSTWIQTTIGITVQHSVRVTF